MSGDPLLDRLPTWVICLASLAIVMLSIEGGLLLARVRRAADESDAGASGSVVGATMGLLAFMLAFTFGMAANRRDTRRDLLLEEVNAIGTAYLRAGLVPQPHQSETRKLLQQYVEVRLRAYDHPDQLPAAIQESTGVQRQLWRHAVDLAQADLKNPDIVSLFIDSLNQMIDLQTKRVTVARYRIPTVVWGAFGFLTVVAMLAVGYHFGQSGKGNPFVSLALALAFSVVVFLIVDLDRAAEGWLRVSNGPMVELYQEMQGTP